MTDLDTIFAQDDPVAVAMDLFPITQKRLAEVGIDGLHPAARLLFCLVELDQEVQNGGFIQYLGNSSGDRVSSARAALETLGASESLALLDAVVARIGPKSVDPERSVRAEVLDALEEEAYDEIDELNDAYYEDPDGLFAAIVGHCREHRDAFS